MDPDGAESNSWFAQSGGPPLSYYTGYCRRSSLWSSVSSWLLVRYRARYPCHPLGRRGMLAAERGIERASAVDLLSRASGWRQQADGNPRDKNEHGAAGCITATMPRVGSANHLQALRISVQMPAPSWRAGLAPGSSLPSRNCRPSLADASSNRLLDREGIPFRLMVEYMACMDDDHAAGAQRWRGCVAKRSAGSGTGCAPVV